MTRLVLDSGGVSHLATRRQKAVALIAVFQRDGLWPPLVPSVVLAETVTGRQHKDANITRFLKTCNIVEEVSEGLALRAGALRTLAGQGSAIDALVVAIAEPGGAVLTTDLADLRALASHSDGVHVHRP